MKRNEGNGVRRERERGEGGGGVKREEEGGKG